MPFESLTQENLPALLILMLVGAVASGINSVAGGGSLISFPYLTLSMGIAAKPANATNAVGLWPGSLAGAYGFRERFHRTGHYLKTLAVPTLLGSVAGALLLIYTREKVFSALVPALLLLATILLAFQPHIKKWALGHRQQLSPVTGVLLQVIVSIYGGYFGAGMGIMMLACFALYMEGDIHDINAVKTWLGVIINLVASIVFITQGMILLWPAVALTIGSLFGGFWAAKLSMKVDSELLRKIIAVYGLLASGYFAWKSWL